MSPIVHGRIFPEIESSRLLTYALRLLIDPRTLRDHGRAILDIDTLRTYLRAIDSPCRVVLLLPAQTAGEFEDGYRFMREIGVEVLPTARIVTPAATAAFPEGSTPPEGIALASTAQIGDVDIVVSEALAGDQETLKRFGALQFDLVGIEAAKRRCEVFVRGHEIPWSFSYPVWRMPWTPFYAMVEADIRMMEEFRSLATRKGVSAEVQEFIRSLALNRWSAIAYTRDKLLFYVIQRRRAKREGFERQDFSFELAYHLTTYFLSLWGALDQISWIVNEICELGFSVGQWRQVGVAKKDFLKRLSARAPEMAAEFEGAEFVRWIEVLKRTRHYVAHYGTAMLSPLYEKPAEEVPPAEIDREVERWAEWRDLASRWSSTMMETLRPMFRMKWLERSYRQISDAGFVIRGATDLAIVFPLENIEWEYEQFRRFMLGVARKCRARLETRRDAPALALVSGGQVTPPRVGKIPPRKGLCGLS
jgi:hypothetical protein